MAPEDQDPGVTDKQSTLENPEVEGFFQRLPANFRWPKPSDEAIAAAMEAIQRVVGGSAGADHAPDSMPPSSEICSGCGSALASTTRFCAQCGLATTESENRVSVPQTGTGAVHHYHHHYHHFVPTTANGSASSTSGAVAVAPRGRTPGSPGTSAGGRAETSARQVAQDWAQACNTKHLDDLLELYTPDATLIRSNIPPVRSLPAIREFLHALLEAGLGELEMESLRVEVMGEIAIDLGRCKMLVPVAMGRRREERGKYLLVLVRQPAGMWRILADCWSADQTLASPTAGEASQKRTEAVTPIRKPR